MTKTDFISAFNSESIIVHKYHAAFQSSVVALQVLRYSEGWFLLAHDFPLGLSQSWLMARLIARIFIFINALINHSEHLNNSLGTNTIV